MLTHPAPTPSSLPHLVPTPLAHSIIPLPTPASTHAAYHYKDDVAPEIKNRRLRELNAIFRDGASFRSQQDISSLQLVLIEGAAHRPVRDSGVPAITGRTDGNKRVLIPYHPETLLPSNLDQVLFTDADCDVQSTNSGSNSLFPLRARNLTTIRAGDFVLVTVVSAGSTTLRALPIALSTMQNWSPLAALLTTGGTSNACSCTPNVCLPLVVLLTPSYRWWYTSNAPPLVLQLSNPLT